MAPTKDEELQGLFAAIGTQGEFARVSRRYLRTTPEYAQAREEGRARQWLDDESYSMGQYLYAAMTQRVLEV